MNRSDSIQRDALRRRVHELEAEAETLRRRVAELEAERRPTDAVSTKTLRIADKT